MQPELLQSAAQSCSQMCIIVNKIFIPIFNYLLSMMTISMIQAAKFLIWWLDKQMVLPAGATIPTPPFSFPIKLQIQLKTAIEWPISMTQLEGHSLCRAWCSTPSSRTLNYGMHWRRRKRRSNQRCKKFGKGISFVKWIESFRDHCY